MITIKVNGADQTLEQSISLAEYLDLHGYKRTRIAVEKNGEIVPKATYESVMLTEADTLEIVTFVGGG